MINVTFVPYAGITVSDNAFLKIVNCTNYYGLWGLDLKNDLTARLRPVGWVSAKDNATVLVEGSKIGVLSLDSGVNCTVFDSYVDKASSASTISPRFVDSEVYELNDKVGNVELDNTEVGNGSRMALRITSSINKTRLRVGEPISVTFRLENIGNLTLYFSNNSNDKFIIRWGNYNIWNDLYLHDKTIPPEYRFPPTIKPGEAFVQTLTWQNSPLPPGKYRYFRCQFYSESLDIASVVGFYTLRIGEDWW